MKRWWGLMVDHWTSGYAVPGLLIAMLIGFGWKPSYGFTFCVGILLGNASAALWDVLRENKT